jgi:hypothetical protein
MKPHACLTVAIACLAAIANAVQTSSPCDATIGLATPLPFLCEWPPTPEEVAQFGVPAALPVLPWANSTDPEYDVEGAIEFCAVTVYARTAGTVTNGTNTSMTMGVQANLTSYGFRIAGQAECISPGPTIVLRPGRRHKLVLRNTLDMDPNPTPFAFYEYDGKDQKSMGMTPGGYVSPFPITCRGLARGWCYAHTHLGTAQLSRESSQARCFADRRQARHHDRTGCSPVNTLSLCGLVCASNACIRG